MRSISSSRLASIERQRGFALISALVLAFLYFGLMQLLLIDSSRSLHEAQRFRARIVAKTLAENGAELAAINMVKQQSGAGSVNDAQGSASGTRTTDGAGTFTITSDSVTAGVLTQRAWVILVGRVDSDGATVHIERSRHSQ
ncbi:MAG TPA: hypothetical protein VJ276_08450 [Thermoanaerobaculia bacterium]|nr:hypothetical protein [Thermoanaerobaculia bacterium]